MTSLPAPPLGCAHQHDCGRGGLEFAPARFAPRHGLRVRAPALGLEVLVDMSGLPRGFGRRNPRATASASSADPVSVVITLSAASATGSS